MIVSNVADATTREGTRFLEGMILNFCSVTGRPVAGFGLKWSLNAQEPVIRQHSSTFGIEPGYKGYRNNEFYKE